MNTGEATAVFGRFDFDFFDVPAVRVLKAEPKGDSVIVFFWECVSIAGIAMLEDGGVEIGGQPATPETLAAYTGRRVAFVRDALNTLATRAKLIECDGDRIRIADWNHYLLPDIRAAIRERWRISKAAQRERQRATTGDAGDVADALPSDAALGIPQDGADQAKVEILRALIETGKFRSLLYEHVALVMREYPRAELEKNFPEIVSEARSVAHNVLTYPLAWLRRAVSSMELRKTKPAGAGRGRSDSPALENPSWESGDGK